VVKPEKDNLLLVQLPNMEQMLAETLYEDKVLGLVVIKIVRGDFGFPSLSLGSDDIVKIDDTVMAFGYSTEPIVIGDPRPLIGEPPYMSSSTVSELCVIDGIEHRGLDRDINSGWYGGPVINKYGEVIGILNQKSEQNEGNTYAIYVNNIKAEIEDALNRATQVEPSIPIPSETRIQTPTLPIYSIEPTHNVEPFVFVYDPYYWNSDWNIQDLWNTIRTINKVYYKQHTYIEDVFDCSDMAVDMWNILLEKGITSLIVVGNLEVSEGHPTWAECNHVWLQVSYLGGESPACYFTIETTNGEVYQWGTSPLVHVVTIDNETSKYDPYVTGFRYATPEEFQADAIGR
jgi:hypothetical protein